MIERTHLTEQILKGKHIAITESLTATWMKKLKEWNVKFTILKIFGHLMGKFSLRMDQEIRVYFMIDSDIVGNRQGLHYGEKKPFYFFMFILEYMWGCV